MRERLNNILEELEYELQDLQEYLEAVYKNPWPSDKEEAYEKGYYEGQLKELKRMVGILREVI